MSVFVHAFVVSLERATVDADGVVGAYASPGGLANINFANFLPDFLGHPAASPEFTDTLPATPGIYQYRIKAVKDGVTVYGTDDSSYNYSRVSVNPRQEIQGTIAVAATTIDGTDRKYQVKPRLTDSSYKNALQTGDKLVVYWISSPNSSGYQTGPWAASQKIEFNKAELEVDEPTGKQLTIPYTAGNYVFAQAYLEYADGTRADVRFSGGGNGFKWDYSQGSPSGAFVGGTQYSVSSGGGYVQHYYVQLLYPASLASTWANGTLASYNSIDTYTLSVANGTTYYIWVNDSYGGDGSKTARVSVNAEYENHYYAFSLNGNSDKYSSPHEFIATADGTVIIKVQPHNYQNGTYGIVYSTTETMP